MSTNQIVSKVWSFYNTLRDDGVGYGDYLEQPTYLLFLKITDEYSKPPHLRTMPIPAQYNWQTLLNKSGDALELHYNNLLRELEIAFPKQSFKKIVYIFLKMQTKSTIGLHLLPYCKLKFKVWRLEN